MINTYHFENSKDYYSLVKPIFPIDSYYFARKYIKSLSPYKLIKPNTIQLLTTESTLCSYRSLNPLEEDIWYITLYTEKGISCIEIGQENESWHIDFYNKEQYYKVIDMISQFSSDWNMRFASHKNFWLDYLENTIDIDSFMLFMENTNKGIPNYSTNSKDEILKWAHYFNPPK